MVHDNFARSADCVPDRVINPVEELLSDLFQLRLLQQSANGTFCPSCLAVVTLGPYDEIKIRFLYALSDSGYLSLFINAVAPWVYRRRRINSSKRFTFGFLLLHFFNVVVNYWHCLSLREKK